MFTFDEDGKLQDELIKEADRIIREDDNNRFHLGELSQMAQKMSYDEQVAMAEMFDTKALFDVLQTRFTELEVVVNSVKHIFEGR